MKVILKEGHIWYDAAQWMRDRERLYVGDVTTVRTSEFHARLGEYFPATEFFVSACEEKRLELTGVVTAIQMVVTPTQNVAGYDKDQFVVTDELDTPGDVKGYYVTMEEIRIQSLVDVEEENFDFDISEFSYGSMNVVLNFAGVRLPFGATYVGDMPLYSLIGVVDGLDYAEQYENCTPPGTVIHWNDEPGSLSLALCRNIKLGSLSIEIEYDDGHSLAGSLVKRKWSISLPYELFRKGVIRAALNCLKTYGLRGCYENWMEEGVDFPLATLIRLIDTRNYDDHIFGEYQSDISADLKVLTDALNVIAVQS